MTRLTRALIWLPLTSTLLAAMPVHAPAQPVQPTLNLPNLGEADLMSLPEERDLGDRIARELYRDPSAADDLILSEYLDQIWQRLLQAARQRGDISPELDARMAWRVVQIRDRAVNAFALPGGYLGIQYGLIAATQDRSELATVMAHELSHVTQRHIARSMDQQSKLSPWMMAALIAGAAAATKNPAAGQALAVGGQAALIQQSLNFSRDMEREADRIGYNQMQRAGFSTDGAVRMFERLQAASRLNDSGAWPYLRTHPLTTERMGDMQSRHAGKTVSASEDLEHLMMAARARTLAETSVDTLRAWAQEPQAQSFRQNHPTLANQVATLYQASLAQAQLRQFASATATAMQLLNLPSASPLVETHARLLLADLAQRQGRTEDVLKWLPAMRIKAVSQSLSLSDVLEKDRTESTSSDTTHQFGNQQGRTATLWRAQAHMANSSTLPLATQALQGWVAQKPDDAWAWQLLSSAWQQQGNDLRALRAQAEASVAQADWSGAKDRLQAAQEAASRKRTNNAADHIEASIIDTRLKWVSDKVRAQLEAEAARR